MLPASEQNLPEKVQNISLLRLIQDPGRYAKQVVSTEAILVKGGRRVSLYAAMSADGIWGYEPEVMLELLNIESIAKANGMDVSSKIGKRLTIVGRISAEKSESNSAFSRGSIDVMAIY